MNPTSDDFKSLYLTKTGIKMPLWHKPISWHNVTFLDFTNLIDFDWPIKLQSHRNNILPLHRRQRDERRTLIYSMKLEIRFGKHELHPLVMNDAFYTLKFECSLFLFSQWASHCSRLSFTPPYPTHLSQVFFLAVSISRKKYRFLKYPQWNRVGSGRPNLS